MTRIKTHKELNGYNLSFETGMEVFEASKYFPKEETYSLSDQIRRYSMFISGNIAKTFRKRPYPKHFVTKLTDYEGEVVENKVWLDYVFTLSPHCIFAS